MTAVRILIRPALTVSKQIANVIYLVPQITVSVIPTREMAFATQQITLRFATGMRGIAAKDLVNGAAIVRLEIADATRTMLTTVHQSTLQQHRLH